MSTTNRLPKVKYGKPSKKEVARFYRLAKREAEGKPPEKGKVSGKGG